MLARLTPDSSYSHATLDPLVALLDRTHARLADHDVSEMDAFVQELDDLRRSTEPAAWQHGIARTITEHPVRALLHQEPIARRAFEKPRGYAGDAVLLDFIYRSTPYLVELTRLGARLHAWADDRPGSVSVRERRAILATLIDHVASRRADARIFSLACGHLREAQVSNAVHANALESFMALDQDRDSLALVDRELHAHRVCTRRASVARFVAAPQAFCGNGFDLAYSAGLFDYLADQDAAAVTRALFRSLRSGGTLLIANFAPELSDIGYMEAIMDWNLIYRSESEMAALAEALPAEEVTDVAVNRDSAGNVVYLTLRKV